MIRWLFRFLKRFVLANVFLIGIARAYSWLLGYDDEMKIWAATNRPLISVVLIISAIIYAMYAWLDEDP